MLVYLRVLNFALVREVELEFGPGLNLLTGETGAGKSILVDALELLLGGEARADMIRAGEERARLEAEFQLDPRHPALAVLAEAGLDGGATLTLRRELLGKAGGRAFVNDGAVTVRWLRQLAATLVDLHGQHEHQDLLRPGAALSLLDQAGGHQELRVLVAEAHAKLGALLAKLHDLQQDARTRAERADLLRYQVRELEEARLIAGEELELSAEAHRLRHAGRLLELARAAHGDLEEAEDSVLARLDRVQRDLRELAGIDPSFEQQRGALEELRIPLAELARGLRDLATNFEFSPQRQEQVEDRLALLTQLARKYGGASEELLRQLAHKQEELRLVAGGAEVEEELQRAAQRARAEYRSLAQELSRRRRDSAARLAAKVVAELKALALERARLEIELHSAPEGPSGIDQAQILFGANPGEGMRPLERVISGGELSRISLALKGLAQASEAARTLVFDEIDAGIGGAVADALGRRLKQLSRRHQVLCVTHLAPVAAYADHHFRVHKQVKGGRTGIGVDRLDLEGRVDELARMVSGADVTPAGLSHARALLKSARASGS